jgi:hypothetical protein
MAAFPSDDTLRNALSLTDRAAALVDPAPWRWRVGVDSVDLLVNSKRRGGADGESREVLLSCGAALHHGVVAFAALGWRADVARLPDPANPDHLATLTFHPHDPEAVDVALAAAIPRRRNDWRPYCTWPVSTADIALIGARAAHAGVTPRRVDNEPMVREAAARAVAVHRLDYEDETAVSRIDIPRRGAPAPDIDCVPDSAVVMALGTKDDTALARLRAGEAMSAAVLSATAVGLATCILAEPWQCADGPDALGANLCSIVGFPQILLRLGWPPVDADPLPSPPRRPFLDFCQWSDGPSLTSA